MDGPLKNERKKMFLEELHQLLEEDYISGKQFNDIARAHHQYYRDLQFDEEIKPKERKTAIQPTTPPDRTQHGLIKMKVQTKQKIEKKKLTSEEIRERNITWSLNLGVILLLISGLFVATSNWAVMTNWMKSSLIGFISFLFFGISYLSKRVLKIEKTGLAFIVLGSLFLPIFLLSIGWFELLGTYLSFNGEGKYIFGLLCCIPLIPIYITIAKKLSSRLFVWFSYLTITAWAAFLIASLQLRQDWFYLGFMLYNAITVIGFHKWKGRENLKLFTNELVAFAQIQLVISSLLTLVFYENQLVNGINILLTAVVYLSMVFVSGKKEYHFVFSTMIVYGAYQVIEHSLLTNFAAVLFVCVGIGFLAVPRFLNDDVYWRKIFQLTSSVVSVAAYIYISFEAFIVNMHEGAPSIAICLAYLLLSVQFVYLANSMKTLIFRYLSPIFLASALFEFVNLANKVMGLDELTFPIFMIGFILFGLLGYYFRYSYLDMIKQSSRDVGLAIMVLGILLTLFYEKWLQLGFISLLLAVAFYICIQIEKRRIVILAAQWLLPLSLALSGSAFSEQLRSISDFYFINFGIAINAIWGSVFSFISYYCWKKLKKLENSSNSFMIGQLFYTMAILFALTTSLDVQWVRPAILIGGIAVYISFYRVTLYQWLPYCIGVMSLISYFALLQSLYLQIRVPTSLIYFENTVAGTILLLIGYFIRSKYKAIAKGLFWIGHLYLPFALAFSFFIFAEKVVWSFIITAVIYFASAYLSTKEWQIRTFLYSGFTSIFLWIVTGMLNLHFSLELQYAFLFTSLVMMGYWLVAAPEFKNRTKYYLVPFSIIGIAAFIGIYPFTLILFIVTVGYSLGLLAYLTLINWNIMTFVPLLLFFSATMQYLLQATMLDVYKMMMVGVIGLVLIIVGKITYQQLCEVDEKGIVKQIDGYTIIAFLFLGAGYLFNTDLIFTVSIPGILISLALWLQIVRVPTHLRIWLKALSGIYLLEPYYATIAKVDIPLLLEREVLVLPLVAVTIFLRYSLKGKYKHITNKIQWIILIFVSLTLVQDGLASSTIYDAIILGTLSLLSMLAGMYWKVKSFFLVGSGVLLLNVLLQTRPFWGNMPWWVYMLIAGSILITVASFNEWNKQKLAKGEITGLTKFKEKVQSWYKKWD
ncbi:hypothetical protein HHO41_09375 [Bacillus sp. DNRA2]|uniref:hypothetical protein n=1 Tax=Bacillus sp. DNRA2 TaxID=2723053 RepID=UPI00145C78F0|nr:hypothetical protein [Bacillus sp. DNRA2]NMD70501.1 hypothetical protein [Bacillus sp. DNRA2]